MKFISRRPKRSFKESISILHNYSPGVRGTTGQRLVRHADNTRTIGRTSYCLISSSDKKRVKRATYISTNFWNGLPQANFSVSILLHNWLLRSWKWTGQFGYGGNGQGKFISKVGPNECNKNKRLINLIWARPFVRNDINGTLDDPWRYWWRSLSHGLIWVHFPKELLNRTFK